MLWAIRGRQTHTHTDIYTQTHWKSKLWWWVWWVSGCHGIINIIIHSQNIVHFKLSSCFITEYFKKHFCPTSEGYWVTPYNHQKSLFSLISYVQNTHKYSLLPQHTLNTNPKTCIQVITLALQQSAQQTYFCLLKHHCVQCFSAQQRGVAGIHNYKNRDSLAFTYKVLTVQSISENDRWQWERFIIALSSEPVGCYH